MPALNPRINRRDRAIDLSLWILAAAFASTTMWFSLITIPPEVSPIPMEDKGLHALSYFATTLSLLFAAVWRPGRGDGPFPHGGRWIIFAGIAAGTTIEVLQGLTVRTPEVADVVAGTAGASTAVLLHWLLRKTFSPGIPPPDDVG